MQFVMGPLPAQWRDLALEMQTSEEAGLPKFTRKKITYRVEPADRVSAWLLVPRGLKAKAPAVLCLHQTVEVGKDEPAGLGANPDLQYALELAERGFVTLAPDYWPFGGYRRQPYDPYEHGYVSGTMKGLWNHIRSLDLLQTLPEVDGRRLGCIGHSLGGHNTLWLAAFDDRVRVAVSSCGFSSFASYASSRYGGGTVKNWAQRCYLPRIATAYDNDPAKVPFDWPEVLAAIAPRAVFVNAPLRDENFLVQGVTECEEAARPVFAWLGASTNLMVVHPDAAHAFPAEVRRQAYEFIERALQAE